MTLAGKPDLKTVNDMMEVPTMRSIVLLGLLGVVLLSGPLQADQVFLKNGDRLSGQIVKLTDGKLVLKL